MPPPPQRQRLNSHMPLPSIPRQRPLDHVLCSLPGVHSANPIRVVVLRVYSLRRVQAAVEHVLVRARVRGLVLCSRVKDPELW